MHLKEYIDLPRAEGWKVGMMPPYPPYLGLRFLEEPTGLLVSVSLETVPNPYCEAMNGLGGKPYLHVTFSKQDQSEVTDEEMKRASGVLLRGKILIPYEIPKWIKEAAKAKFEQESGQKLEGDWKVNTKHCCCLIPAEVA